MFFHALTFAFPEGAVEGRGFQQLPRDLANLNALENNVRLLLLHKFNHNAEKIPKMVGHYFRPQCV